VLDRVTIEVKEYNDFVTKVDRKAEEVILNTPQQA